MKHIKYRDKYGDIYMNQIDVDKKVIRTGGSLGFRLTKELRMLDAKEGEVVSVRIVRKCDE